MVGCGHDDTHSETIVRISQRGQVTIPKKLRDQFGLHHNAEVEITPTESGLLIRKCAEDATHPVDRAYGVFAKPGWSTDAYMKEIRGR